MSFGAKNENFNELSVLFNSNTLEKVFWKNDPLSDFPFHY